MQGIGTSVVGPHLKPHRVHANPLPPLVASPAPLGTVLRWRTTTSRSCVIDIGAFSAPPWARNASGTLRSRILRHSTTPSVAVTCSPWRCVFDLSVSGGSGNLKGEDGGGNKNKNKEGPGAQGVQTAPRRGPRKHRPGVRGHR